MQLKIDPHSSTPLYAQIVEQVIHLIQIGKLQAGQTLTSVRGLSESLNINSLTIQKAYKLLEAQGWVEIKKGIGVFVATQVSQVSASDKKQQARDFLQIPIEKAHALLKNKQQLEKIIQAIVEKLND